MLATIDTIRREATQQLDQDRRSKLGQYLTPMVVASFMASLFSKPGKKPIRLLDAGAGVGSLSIAFLEAVKKHLKGVKTIDITGYDLDAMLLKYMDQNMQHYRDDPAAKETKLDLHLFHRDFIEDAVFLLQMGKPSFTHAILNPPYKKINSNSTHRKLLREVGIETVNLYSAFVALAIMMLEDKGELVAIIPRSFCNGNYYKPFRKIITDHTAIKQMHLFNSRDQAFKEDDVLQENIIIHLKKGAKQGKVIVSRSTDETMHDYAQFSFAFKQIVKPSDAEAFIHVPNEGENHIEGSSAINSTLEKLGLMVSTGPVVDFRATEYTHAEPVAGTVPLLYPVHFNGKEMDWPKQGKKPNAIDLNEETQKMLFPNGFYTLVKRFSSKEEKQRIVARVVNPAKFDAEFIGLENHLNVFHIKKTPLQEEVAYGLAAYLNSSFVDTHFRSFNGHTQVNATDLKQMPYPSLEALIALGSWAKNIYSFDQNLIDSEIAKLL
jgi:adenine-specific DNA-methyltransferase